MLLTNLTGERYKYKIDPKLIEKSLDENESGLFHVIESELDTYDYRIGKAKIIPFCNNMVYDSDSIFQMFRQVPIFLVTKQQCLKTFTVGYFGHKDDVTVPLDMLPNNVPDSDTIDKSDYEDVDPYRGERNRDYSIVSCIDLWGVYTREYPNRRFYRIDESHPRIFIWVDKIYDFVNGDSHNYRLLASQVILHELAHAMMDINIVGPSIHSSDGKINKTFYTLKEESLANAISLSLIKPYINDNDWNFLVSIVKQQPFQYALGLEYLDNNGRVIRSSIEKWMELKKDCDYSDQVVKEWIRYVKGQRPLDCDQLELLDSTMQSPNYLFRYPALNGRFYDNHDVAVKVIKDYLASHPAISRAESHKAFPDAINDRFEPIIDYPENTKFHDKDSIHTLSVDGDKIFDCIDGKIAICNFWHPRFMGKFIKNASTLGYEIESFE